MSRVLPVGALLLALSACSDDASPAGREGEACRPDSTCEPGLSCLAGICVRSPDASVHDLLPPGLDITGSDWDLPPPDAPPPVDNGTPKPDQPTVKLDAPTPTPDKGAPPVACKQWSGWSCVKNPQPNVVCWATCSGAKGAVWCDGSGTCRCTGAVGTCASGVKVNLAAPCASCKTALETHGCCKP